MVLVSCQRHCDEAAHFDGRVTTKNCDGRRGLNWNLNFFVITVCKISGMAE